MRFFACFCVFFQELRHDRITRLGEGTSRSRTGWPPDLCSAIHQRLFTLHASRDTSYCPAPGGLRLSSDKQMGILTCQLIRVNKKLPRMVFFLRDTLHEIRTTSYELATDFARIVDFEDPPPSGGLDSTLFYWPVLNRELCLH